MCGKDCIELFGDSGTGKTTFALEMLKKANFEKKLYIDTERNLLKEPDFAEYKYIPSFKELYSYVLSLPDGYQFIVLDSIGLPILGEWATLKLDKKGDILSKTHAISYFLKNYSYRNNAVILVINQPESEFAKDKGHILRPFGDKSIYYYKEVWKSELLYSTPTKTVCQIKAFRSRAYGRGALLYKITIDKNGAVIESINEVK